MLAAGTMLSASAGAAPTQTDWEAGAYRGAVDVVESNGANNQDSLQGVVFDDTNKNSVLDGNERGLNGAEVSNGRKIATTDAKGSYELPAFENMTVFVTQPRGYQVPIDENNVAQFFYNYLPEGSPQLTYGGIAPTGQLPQAVNFPLTASKLTQSPEQHCAIGADIQTYNQKEVEFARNGVFTDLAARQDYAGCGALFIGDLVGDDLSVFDQTRELTSMLNGPARFLPGVLTLDIKNMLVTERFTTRGGDGSDQMVLSLNTSKYRAWYAENITKPRSSADELENPLEVSRDELAEQAWLTTNFWMGSTGSTVEAAIDGGGPVVASRTQQLRGEDPLIGAEYSDPVAIMEQFVHGGGLADRSMHLWRLALPADLEVGEHTAKVTSTDVHGRKFTETLVFEVTK